MIGSHLRKNFVKIVEVGPRDGLQNEKKILGAETKLELIEKLVNAGLRTIESTSFVSPKWVPQMASSTEIIRSISKNTNRFPPNVSYPALVPNSKGYENAIQAGVKEIAVFAAASESFSKKNINCSIKESLERFASVFDSAKKDKVLVRGYVSCVVGCPYEGKVSYDSVSYVAKVLLDMGCYEISLGDTIGVGTPLSIGKMIETVSAKVDISKLAIHAHDTYGQALANILQSLNMGIRTIDSSVGGLGGCPYAAGATGNVATEDVVYMVQGMNYDVGDIKLEKLSLVGKWISDLIDRPYASRAGSALLHKLMK